LTVFVPGAEPNGPAAGLVVKETPPMFDTQSIWMFATVLGPVVLGAIIAYALLTRRRLSPREKRERDAATHRLYDEENRKRS
jgi:hypothetical protein